MRIAPAWSGRVMPWGEIVRYGVAGGLNTVLTFAAYALMVMGGVPYLLANLLAWVLGLVCGYFLGLLFVFAGSHQPRRGNPRQFAMFGAVYVVNFGISSLALMGLVESGLLGPVQAQFVVIPLVALLNFVASKFLVFGRR